MTVRPHAPRTTGSRPGVRPRTLRLSLGLAALVAGLCLAAFLGVAVGARSVPLATVVDSLLHPRPGDADHTVVRELRVPRTLIGLAVGAALGLAGALMQGLTRNPIADPGLLGVNAGASLGVVAAITALGAAGAAALTAAAMAGALVASVLVWVIGATGQSRGDPVRVALVGAAVTAGATSVVTLLLLRDVDTLDVYRFWVVGSVAVRDVGMLAALAPVLAAGAVLALTSARALNAMAMGEDLARGLGGRIALTRLAAAAAVVLLCGGATALAGPIVFVGLVAPHVARALTGPDQRWILRYAAVIGAILLVLADVVGRLVAPPGELEAGLVVAFVGAPLMIALVRRRGVVR